MCRHGNGVGGLPKFTCLYKSYLVKWSIKKKKGRGQNGPHGLWMTPKQPGIAWPWKSCSTRVQKIRFSQKVTVHFLIIIINKP